MEGNRPNRLRKFLLLVVVAAVGSAVATVVAAMVVLTSDTRSPNENGSAGAQTVERPNIVFVMTDDLDEQSMEQLSGIRNIMGSNGTTFENAYVTYSLCCPSRATILRGQYAHNHHIIGNSPPQGGAKKFRESGLDKSTMATWLNADYRTKYIGKYMNGYGGLNVPPGWDEWFVLMGDPKDGRINQNGKEIALSGHSTDVFANNASDFIRRSAVNSDPFFVTIGTVAPHSPPPVADRYKGFFGNTALPRPPNFDEMDVADKPRYIQSYDRLTSTKITSLQSQYRQRLRSMLSVEDLLRQITTTLRDTDELENTYIFFTSDNGFHMGNHRVYPGGKWLPYEEDIGVPLMVRGPGVPANTTRQQLVINNDFAPTIADLADAQIPAFVDGRSFAPLLSTSAPSSWREAFLEEGWLQNTSEPGVPKVPTHQGVHTQDHMLVEYDTGERELYDLIQDPYQLQSKGRMGNESLYSALETRLYNLRDCSGAACRTAESTTDTTAPMVTSTVPAATNAPGVASSANLTATFSEDMKASTINTTTFKLFQRGSTTQVGASVSYSASTDRATLDPTNPLKTGVTYDVRLTTEAEDLVGNHLDQSSTTTGLQQKAWSFTVST